MAPQLVRSCEVVREFATRYGSAHTVRRAGRRLHSTREVAVAAGSVQIALVAFAVAALFHPVAYQFYFFLAAGLALAVQNVLRSAVARQERLAA